MTRCSAVLQLNYLGRPRSTQRRELVTPDDEMALTEDIVRLAGKYGRYGYRRVTAFPTLDKGRLMFYICSFPPGAAGGRSLTW